MRNTIFALFATSAAFCISGSADAMTANLLAANPSTGPSVTLVRDGCGIGYNRGPMGMCRPNGFPVRVLRDALGGACPPTYHLGPFGRRCYSNY